MDDSRSSATVMLMWMNSVLRRRRRQALLILAVVAVGTVAITAHSMVMRPSTGHDMGDAAMALCIAVGGGLVAAGAMAFAKRRPRLPSWPLAASAAHRRDITRVAPVHLARAGPPPLLQVFRL
jgi:drug/metabolite transporter (DMT)-like permease